MRVLCLLAFLLFCLGECFQPPWWCNCARGSDGCSVGCASHPPCGMSARMLRHPQAPCTLLLIPAARVSIISIMPRAITVRRMEYVEGHLQDLLAYARRVPSSTSVAWRIAKLRKLLDRLIRVGKQETFTSPRSYVCQTMLDETVSIWSALRRRTADASAFMKFFSHTPSSFSKLCDLVALVIPERVRATWASRGCGRPFRYDLVDLTGMAVYYFSRCVA